MIKFLIFRKDRIGDYIVSRILIESIKSKYTNNRIGCVCCLYNSNYIKYYIHIHNEEIYVSYTHIRAQETDS